MNVEELERRLIRDAQRELAPALADRERHQAALAARLGPPAPLGGAGSELERVSPGARTGTLSGSNASLLGMGLAIGVVVGGWFGYSLGVAQRAAAPGSAAAAVAAGFPSTEAGPTGASGAPAPGSAGAEAAPVAIGAAPGAAAPEAASSPVGSSPGEVLSQGPAGSAARVESADGAGVARSPKPPARAGGAPPGSESSLAEEVAMLQRARRALAAENGQLALGLVQELDERFPRGVLLEERSATRVLGLCKLARLAEARRYGREFLARHPGSVYAERVRASCAGTPE